MEPSRPTTTVYTDTSYVQPIENKIVEIISKIDANQIEDISKTVLKIAIDRLEWRLKGKIFKFSSEYDLLTQLITPILIKNITVAFSTPENFIIHGHKLIISNPEGNGLFDLIENTCLKNTLETIQNNHDAWSDDISFMLFHKRDKKTYDLTIDAFVSIFEAIIPLYTICPLQKNLK